VAGEVKDIKERMILLNDEIPRESFYNSKDGQKSGEKRRNTNEIVVVCLKLKNLNFSARPSCEKRRKFSKVRQQQQLLCVVIHNTKKGGKIELMTSDRRRNMERVTCITNNQKFSFLPSIIEWHFFFKISFFVRE
jgi:hypothetical protein